MKIGYLGPTGSFSESAAKEFFKEEKLKDLPTAPEYILYPSLDRLQEAFFVKEVDFIVIPIFNSKEKILKSLEQNRDYIGLFYDKACTDSHFQIVGEKFFELNFCLITKPDTKKENIIYVNVNPYGETLCRTYLDKHPQWKVVKFSSSSAAAKDLLQKNKDHAALASKTAAQAYGLSILEENVISKEDVPIMHFLVLSNHQNFTFCPANRNNISIYIATPDLPSDYLAILKEKNIPLLNIYIIDGNKVYFEIEGILSPADEKILNAKQMGCFENCCHRNTYQEIMATDEFKMEI